jgi:hypothetical protein
LDVSARDTAIRITKKYRICKAADNGQNFQELPFGENAFPVFLHPDNKILIWIWRDLAAKPEKRPKMRGESDTHSDTGTISMIVPD